MQQEPPLRDRIEQAFAAHHLSPRTRKAYLGWIRRFVVHQGRHPRELDAEHVRAFLDSLARERGIGASTHIQALCAIRFLYRRVLRTDPPWIEDLERPRRVPRLPVVLTRSAVYRIVDRMRGTPLLMAELMYGSGLRVLECARLRVKDIDFEAGQLLVRDSKGQRDRHTLLPVKVRPPLRQHCHGHSRAALGYFACRASGSST